MHPALLNILGWLGGVTIGVLSAATIVGLWWLLNRRFRVRLETVFGVCGLIGFVMMFAGRMSESRLLVGASVALWGWAIVPIVLIPLVLLWRFFSWCRQRIAG